MSKKRQPTKFLNIKLIKQFLHDYQKMPYKSKSTIMAAVLVVLLIPLALIYPLPQSQPSPINLAPLEPTNPPPTECFITGCADHLCLDSKIEAPNTNCNLQPELLCLKYSKCELQPSGQCGWTKTPQYLQCINK